MLFPTNTQFYRGSHSAVAHARLIEALHTVALPVHHHLVLHRQTTLLQRTQVDLDAVVPADRIARLFDVLCKALRIIACMEPYFCVVLLDVPRAFQVHRLDRFPDGALRFVVGHKLEVLTPVAEIGANHKHRLGILHVGNQ